MWKADRWCDPPTTPNATSEYIRPVELLSVVVISYILGSIPSALWAGKLTRGIDIREHGSGNMGTTNTFRVLGWKAGAMVALIDLGKGWFSSNMVAKLVPHGEYYVLISMTAGLCAILGHVFPLFAGFRGGKGAITAAGVMLGVAPVSTSWAIGVFLVTMFSSRYVSLASILAVISFPLVLYTRLWFLGHDVDLYLRIAGIVIPLMVIIKHHSNIRRLLRGEESRLPAWGSKSA